MLILAFDTATGTTTTALVRDGDVLGERLSTAVRVLADADALLREAGVEPGDVSSLVVGIGPGSFTGIRIGLAAARGLAWSLSVPVAGVSTLEALAAGAPGAVPVIDAKRKEIFTVTDGRPEVLSPDELDVEPGTLCVGDGAVRYRALLEEKGATVPPDDSELHLPRARFHAALAHDFGASETVEPIYLRIPDAERRSL
jgi:tRNA threonylcarbamoyladenosine biosynthesis protein TsaB